MVHAARPHPAEEGLSPEVWVVAAVVVVGMFMSVLDTTIVNLASAFVVLSSAQVPRARGALNAIQRVGGAVGTALLAVVLEHELRAASSREAGAGSASGLATAFGHSFWWAVGLSVLAIVPAAILAITRRRERDAAASKPAGAAATAVGTAA